MAALEALDKAINEHDSSTSESVTGSVDSVQRMPDLLVESTNKGSFFSKQVFILLVKVCQKGVITPADQNKSLLLQFSASEKRDLYLQFFHPFSCKFFC